jgi:hypothetical protein
MLSAEHRWDTNFVSVEDNVQWKEDYAERETVVARKRVPDTETAIIQEQEDMRHVEMARSTTTKPEATFAGMLNAVEDSLSNLASSDDEEDG